VVAMAALVVGLFAGQLFHRVEAQSEGSAQTLIAVSVQSSVRNRVVLFLIDGREQTVMTYDYDVAGGSGLILKAARSFRFDKSLEDWVNDRDRPIRVNDVANILERMGPKR